MVLSRVFFFCRETRGIELEEFPSGFVLALRLPSDFCEGTVENKGPCRSLLLECETSKRKETATAKYKKEVRTNYSVPEVEVDRQSGRTDLMSKVDQTLFCPSTMDDATSNVRRLRTHSKFTQIT